MIHFLKEIFFSETIQLFGVLFSAGFIAVVVYYLTQKVSKKPNLFEFLNSLLVSVAFSAIVLFFLEMFAHDYLFSKNEVQLSYFIYTCICCVSSLMFFQAYNYLAEKQKSK